MPTAADDTAKDPVPAARDHRLDFSSPPSRLPSSPPPHHRDRRCRNSAALTDPYPPRYNHPARFYFSMAPHIALLMLGLGMPVDYAEEVPGLLKVSKKRRA